MAIDVDLSGGTVRPWQTDAVASGVTTAGAMFDIQGCCILSDPSPCASFAEGNPSPTCQETVYKTTPGATPKAATHSGACTNAWRDLSFPLFPKLSVVAPPVPNDDTMEQLYAFYTVTDDWGRESAPSIISDSFYANFGTTLLFSGFPTAYPNGKTIKIYISRAAWASGNELELPEERSGYYLASEFPIGPASNTAPLDFPGLANTTWDYEPAPDDLWSIQSFRGGQLLGLSGNTVRASIKNVFHAWPKRYAIRFYGNAQTLVAGKSVAYVLTDEAPLVMRIPAGCDGPQCFLSKQIDRALPVANQRSAAIYGDTVIYATYDGLVALTGEEWKYFPQWSRRHWRALRPDAIIGVVHNDAYFFTNGGKTYRLSLREEATQALTEITTPGKVLSFYESSRGYLLIGTDAGIYKWNEGPGYKTAKWQRTNAAHGPIRRVNIVDVIGIGASELSVFADGVVQANLGTSGHTQARVRSVRGTGFGVRIITKGEVSQVIMGSSIQQVAQL